MKLSSLIICSCLLPIAFHSCSPPENPTSTTMDTTYQLVWQDEFEVDGKPDPNHWNFEQGFVRNREDQWYQPENAFCEDGFLIIEARKEQKPNPDYQTGSDDWKKNRDTIQYTSSSLLTRGLHSWQYGRFEIRAKIDTRPGMWPAFWTLGEKGSWPACGEIDIMEYYRGMILANAAWAGPEGKTMWDDVKKNIESFDDPAWANEFHTWRMDWDENTIKLYVDDLLLNQVDLSTTINGDGSGSNPFHHPHYIIVNFAIGGTNGGDPAKTTFPARYLVDYVRVYQKNSK